MLNLNDIRSFLFTPAHKSNLFDKSFHCGADIVVLDLEDACPLEYKNIAHVELIKKESYLKSGNFIYRINGLDTVFGLKDILFIIESKLIPFGVIVPKVENAEMINIIKGILNGVKLIAAIESSKGLQFVHEIASVSDALIFGSADYSAEFGILLKHDNLLHVRNAIVVAAAAAKIPAIDTACFEMYNKDQLRSECAHIKSLGFSGKAAIHPLQVKLINEALSPTQEDIEWARKVIDSCDKGVSNMDGFMIGPPFIKIAKKILKIN